MTLHFPDIAFVGKAGAGKTTAAEILATGHGYRRLSLAGPLKDMAVQLWGPAAAKDRVRLQRLGVAVRDIDEHTWVDLLARRIFDTREPVVVDDVRFPNEFSRLRGLGFIFVRICAPLEVRKARLLRNGKWAGEAALRHVSEVALDGYVTEYEIDNNDDPQHLADALARILDKEVQRT